MISFERLWWLTVGPKTDWRCCVEGGEVDCVPFVVTPHGSYGVIAGMDHCTVRGPPFWRERDAAPMFPTGGVRFRAKSRTGASIRLPQPRFVQTLLSALSRLQCGQINLTFGKDMASSTDEQHHVTVRSVRECLNGGKRTTFPRILYWEFYWIAGLGSLLFV